MTKIEWFYKDNDEVLGPYNADETWALYESGKIDHYTYVYDDQTEEWEIFNTEQINRILSHVSKTTSTTQPLSLKKTPDETEPKTLWQKFQKWNDLDSVPETSLWHDNKNWYWIIIIVGFVIYRGFFKS